MLPRDRHVVVGFETCEFARITLVVAEVGAVAVEDEEHLLRRGGLNDAAHFVQQLHVVARRADIDQVVGVAGQLVDHGALRRLVGDEPRLEARFVEEGRKPFAAVELVVLLGRDGGEDERHALVRGVALRQHVAENHQIVHLREPGIGLPFVAVKLPAHGARRFTYNIYVNLASGRFGFAAGLVGEIRRGLFEVVGLAEFRGAQVDVVGHVERENFVAQHVPLLAHMIGRPQGQHAQRHERGARKADVHARRARNVALVADLARREPQQRQIHHADQNDRRVDVAQQFTRLAGIGRHQIGEHVRGDDRVAEQIEQHDLERAEKDKGKSQPDHHAGTAQRHAPHHVEAQRHQNQRLDRPAGVRLGIGQHAVGDNQRDEEIDGQQRGETAAGFDRASSVYPVRISIHIVTLT